MAYINSPVSPLVSLMGLPASSGKCLILCVKKKLSGVSPYLDNISICGKDQAEHDANLKLFLEAAKWKNMTYNDSKSVFSTRRLAILGYIIEEGEIRPDPERLRPLRELLVPTDTADVKGYYLTIRSGSQGFQTG